MPLYSFCLEYVYIVCILVCILLFWLICVCKHSVSNDAPKTNSSYLSSLLAKKADSDSDSDSDSEKHFFVATMATNAQFEDLRRTLLEIHNRNKELVSVNAGLVEGKREILKALKKESLVRKTMMKDQTIKNGEIRFLKESLAKEKILTERFRWSYNVFNKDEDQSKRQAYQKEVNCIMSKNKALTKKYKEMLIKNKHETTKSRNLMVENKDLIMKNMELERQEVEKLKTSQEFFDEELSRVVVEKDNVIQQILTEKKALETETSECVAKLEKTESEIFQSEAKWQRKVSALEDKVRRERAAKGISEIVEELDRKSREMEDEWHLKEAQREEEMENLARQNTELRVLQLSLQELAQKTDKEKAKLRRTEKKAEEEELKRQKTEKEEMEKRRKKETKKEAEREKKVKMENEKREMEELKRLKKEEEEKEKRDKKERKEEAEREKKVKMENEKREMEELKRLKKEEEEKE
ncbi:calponin homology domain-containing protein DDB_G0272472-like isoform X2 [Etheostoma cragini]|uniref:calponin homology domain-containing protein DDB_G0272472-like isoform X2 n=1 Tax=Etheostoma cragini TaxID=417921 RepID=UPI00155EA205|nr:calponin homology domain-containing protein DDB_G0272472-like isoform X2 [Etheostoma cragini]